MCACVTAIFIHAQAGFKQLAQAALSKVEDLSAQQITDLVVGFHKCVRPTAARQQAAHALA